MLVTVICDENMWLDIHYVVEKLLDHGEFVFFIEHYELSENSRDSG